MTLENILADFQLLDDWEDRYRYVIELGRAPPPLQSAAMVPIGRHNFNSRRYVGFINPQGSGGPC